MYDNPRLGIALMIATTVFFAVQDGISRYLAENYNVITVVTIRYMFFMCFVLAYSSRQEGGIQQMASSGQLPLKIGRGLLLVAQICVAILSFSTVGLVNFHAVFCKLPADGHGAFSAHSWRGGWVAALAGGLRWLLRRAVDPKTGNRNV